MSNFHITFLRSYNDGTNDSTYAFAEGQSPADAVTRYVNKWAGGVRDSYDGVSVFVVPLDINNVAQSTPGKLLKITITPPSPPVPVVTVEPVSHGAL